MYVLNTIFALFGLVVFCTALRAVYKLALFVYILIKWK
jgi:hypothetical protein